MCVNSFQSCEWSTKSNQKNPTAHTKNISLGENSTSTEAALKLGLVCLSVAPQRRLLVSIFWTCWKVEHGSCNSAAELPQTNSKTTPATCLEQTSAVENASLQRESAGEYLWDPKSKWVLAEIFSIHCVIYEIYVVWPLCPREVVDLCSQHCWEEQYFCAGRCRMEAELRSQPLLLLLSYGGRRRRMDLLQTSSRNPADLLQTSSRPSPDVLQTFSRVLPGLMAPDRLSGAGRAQDAEPPKFQISTIPEHPELFWSHLRCVSLAQAARAALPLEGMGEIWNSEPFGGTWALLTGSFSLWTLLRHPVEHPLDPTALPIPNEMSKWNQSWHICSANCLWILLFSPSNDFF